jgi:hypothetical protein
VQFHAVKAFFVEILPIQKLLTMIMEIQYMAVRYKMSEENCKGGFYFV